MLSQCNVVPVVPVSDLERSRTFYEEKLGLHPTSMLTDPGSLVLEAGGGTRLQLDARDPAQIEEINRSEHTLLGFEVSDIEDEVRELEQRGVKFEDYHVPGIDTDAHHIASINGSRAAWLKDPDGNVLCVHQRAHTG